MARPKKEVTPSVVVKPATKLGRPRKQKDVEQPSEKAKGLVKARFVFLPPNEWSITDKLTFSKLIHKQFKPLTVAQRQELAIEIKKHKETDYTNMIEEKVPLIYLRADFQDTEHCISAFIVGVEGTGSDIWGTQIISLVVDFKNNEGYVINNNNYILTEAIKETSEFLISNIFPTIAENPIQPIANLYKAV